VARIDGDDMNYEKPTQEQDKQLRKLAKKFAFRLALRALKFGSLLFLANLVVSLVNLVYIHSAGFMFIGVVMNTIFLFRTFRHDLTHEHERCKEEAKKIMEQKGDL
jgi:hypothetical protein